MVTAKAIECCLCGDPLDGEEADNPYLDDGDVICNDCYHERYEFTCCCCAEYGHVDDQHKLLVVFEETSRVTPGIYRIGILPYYTDCLIGSGWLHPESLTRIADLNPDMDGNGYPCGHLCARCQSKVLAQKPGKCSACGQKAASCLRVRLGSWKDFDAGQYQWTRPKIVCAKCRHEHRGSWKLARERKRK